VTGADRLDRAPLPQGQQEERQASLSVGHHAASHSIAAVVLTQRSGHGRELDRGADHVQFCRSRADQCRIPDETTILKFRHQLEKHDLGEQLIETVKAHLSARGMTMRQGTIVDATLIAYPSSTKNKQTKRDPEMHQTKKGNQ